MHSLKRFYCCFLFLSGFNYGHAQVSKIDSLTILIAKARSDTARINLTVKKIAAFSNINLDSAISLSLKTLSEAQALHYYKGEVDIRHKLTSNYCYKGNYKAAAEQIAYLENFIKPVKDSIEFANLYGNFGMFYGMQSKYDSSIYFLEKAIHINEGNTGSKTNLSRNYANIAIGYQQQSNYTVALDYYQKGLKLAEEQNDEINQAYAFTNIANTYDMMSDTARAETSFVKSIVLAKKNQLKNVELYAYSNLSSLYINSRRWQKAYEYAMKAATLGDEMRDQGIQAASLSKAATSVVNLNNPVQAIAIAKKAIAIADSIANPYNTFQAYSSMGYILRIQQKWKEAIPFYEKSFASLKNADLYEVGIAQSFKELSDCYEKTGDLNNALTTYKKYADIKDSASSHANIQKATELTMNYEFAKKQAVAKAGQDKKDAETKRIKNQQLVIIIALCVIVLAVVAIALQQLRSNKHKQQTNLALQQQKEKVEATLSELKATQTQLIQSEKMASLGELTAGIAHEIQNPLNFVNNFSEVNNELIEEVNEETDVNEIKILVNSIKQNNEKITFHGKRADSIVKNMLLHSRQSKGEKQATDINALADEYLRLSYHGLRAKDKSFNATLKTDFDPSTEKVNVVTQDMGRVLLNLFNNAFYAVMEKKKNGGDEQYEPTVSVRTKKTGDKIAIIIKDNGMGISKSVMDKIFQPFFTTKPTGQGTGLGLSLSYDIVKAHGGELKIESKEGEGSESIIILSSLGL